MSPLDTDPTGSKAGRKRHGHEWHLSRGRDAEEVPRWGRGAGKHPGPRVKAVQRGVRGPWGGVALVEAATAREGGSPGGGDGCPAGTYAQHPELGT